MQLSVVFVNNQKLHLPVQRDLHHSSSRSSRVSQGVKYLFDLPGNRLFLGQLVA